LLPVQASARHLLHSNEDEYDQEEMLDEWQILASDDKKQMTAKKS
jgi:hypothetical protein